VRKRVRLPCARCGHASHPRAAPAEACRQAARWNADGARGLRMGVNVTAAQFKSARLVSTVERAL
jgi:EAL domain-containing protein (putative c-di-GMP-specific phosphodiesterase class I)